MKAKIFLIVLVCLGFLTVNTYSQNSNYALFIHGYESNGPTAWTNNNKVGNIAQNWVNEGILSGYQAPTIIDFTNPLQVAAKIDTALSVAPSSKWIVIGHSLGGLIGRASESYIKNDKNINLKGIITLGTPHRGAPVAGFAVNKAYAQSLANQAYNDILAGPQWQEDYGYLDFQLGLVYSIYDLFGGVTLYEELAPKLSLAHTKITGYIERASSNHADYLIPGSTYLQQNVYSVNSSVPHISISGIENSPYTFIRFISTIDDIGNDLGNEKTAVAKIKDAISCYQFAENYHKYYCPDFLQYIPGLNAIWYVHYAGWKKWEKGRKALQDLDLKWNEMHDEIIPVTQSITFWVNCSDLLPIFSGESVKNLEVLFQDVYSACADGNITGFYKTEVVTAYYYAPTDGFVPWQYTQWNASEGITLNPTTAANYLGNLRQGNVAFDGTGEADGGYNHGELRYHIRDNDKVHTSTPTTSTPMKFAQAWASEWLKN